MSLARHEQLHSLDRIADLDAQAVDRFLVADIAMGRRLPGTDILVVLLLCNCHRPVEAAQITVETSQSFVILGLERPGQRAFEAPDTPQHRLGKRRLRSGKLCPHLFEQPEDGLFFARREELGSWRRQKIITPLHEHLVLLDPQPQPRIEIPELRVHVG